ncbi:MAG: hypothetical protein JSR17_03100, partial [Proteobacteria bacterium]|nr:hypothetical protein [Pseudomonadota bacterium]
LLQQSAVPNLQTGNLAMPSDTFFANCVKDNNLSAQLFKDLYQVCSYPPKGLDLDEISSILAAMANKYSLTELLIALRMLQKNFELSQKLISVFVLKELIAHYDPLSHRDIKFVMAVYAPSFFKGNPFKSFGPLLEKSAVLRMQSDDHRVNMYHTLEGLITQNIYNQSQTGFDTMFRLTNTSTSKQAKGVAEELRAYSLRLYQQLNIKELTTIKSKDKNRQQTAPSVFAIEQYFNLLSNYIVTKIITMDDLQQRARYVRLCVRICEALLGGDMPDYNSAMSVFAALNQASVVRLKKTFATLDKSTHDKLEVISTKLAQHGNYKEIRKVLAENQYAIPYLGIIASDLTFSQENTAFNTYAMMGKVIRQVATRINALKRVHLPLNSNIARTIRYLLPMDEKELFHLSLVQEPREPTQKADDGLIATQFERSRTSLALTQSTSDVSLNKGSTLKH